MGANENRLAGKSFEEVFEKRALSNNLLPIKNHLQCRHTYGGRLQVIKSELDWKLINSGGRVAYVDCKSYSRDHFTYSDICEHQLRRSLVYGSWGVPSGFVVLFQPSSQIVYFSGHAIQYKGPKSRFEAVDGQPLGSLATFDLKLIYSI